jgi:hypothetical protein
MIGGLHRSSVTDGRPIQGSAFMARIILADNPVDWIMFANAHRYMMKYPGSQIQLATNCTLGTMAANEPLLAIGHADVNGLGVNAHGMTIYTGGQFGNLLHAHQLRLDQRKITLPGSCEVASGRFTGFIYELRQQLTRHNYRQVEVKGALGLAIGGWAQKRVVDPAQRAAYIVTETGVMGAFGPQIGQANAIINALPLVPNSAQLAWVAQQVFNAVQPFYAALAGAAGHHLLPAGEGFRVSM